jgi:endoglucanase
LVLDTVRRLHDEAHPNIVYGAATVQEEVGLRGAGTLSYVIDPSIALIVESGPATDTPDIGSDEITVCISRGPVLSFFDRTMISHTGLLDFVMECANQSGIDVQFRVGSGGTDGGRVHVHGAGVPSLVISVPTRYIHSHNAIIHLDDVEQTAQLIVEVCKKLDAGAVADICR